MYIIICGDLTFQGEIPISGFTPSIRDASQIFGKIGRSGAELR